MNATVEVTGIVVVVAPKSMTVRERTFDVAVVSDRQLLRWLGDRPNLLASMQTAAIVAAALRPGTWHRNPPAEVDPAFLQNEFARLRSLVESARRRRAGWLLALLIGAPLVLATLSANF
jgi:hypothetical protein